MTPCTKYFWMKGYTQMMGTVDTTMVEYFMTLAMVCSCAAAVGSVPVSAAFMLATRSSSRSHSCRGNLYRSLRKIMG